MYDTLAHWMWASWLEKVEGGCVIRNGWLKEMGALDFAGMYSVSPSFQSHTSHNKDEINI